METRQQRSERNGFDAFSQKRAKLTSRANANLAQYTDRPLDEGEYSVHVPDGKSQKIGS